MAPEGLWRALPAWGRFSLLGLIGAAALAVGLGVFIPSQVATHMMGAQLDADRQVLAVILRTALPGGVSDPIDVTATDAMLRDSLLGEGVVRIKLWAPDGTILYSDEPRLIGRTFGVKGGLTAALDGGYRAAISDLTAPENEFERVLAPRLMEIYLPVRDGGEVTAVWEIYRTLDALEAHLGRVRVAVWVSVGSGLGVLLIFLVSTFGSLLAVAQRGRREAEERSGELSELLGEKAVLNRNLQAAQAEQRRLMSRLVHAHEQERGRIVGEVHDGLGQDLHRLLFVLRGSRTGLPGDVDGEMQQLEELLEGCIRRFRRLLQELRPPSLDRVPLEASVRGLCDRVAEEEGLEVRLRCEQVGAVSPPARVALFRIAQEALRNVARHAGTRHVSVDLTRRGDVVELRVRDAGRGIPPDPGPGLGLWLMRERAAAFGGLTEIRATEDGTEVVARVPVEAPSSTVPVEGAP